MLAYDILCPHEAVKVLHLKSPFHGLTTGLLVSMPEFNLRSYKIGDGSGGSNVGV